jgi:DNA polymerase (family 10)
VDNADLARAFFELADLVELAGQPAYKVRAFRAAGRAIETLSSPCSDLLAQGRLLDVPGIGQGSVRRIQELLEHGKLAEIEGLRRNAPPALAEMMRVDGMGPKTADLVYRTLGIGTLDDLEAAARAGRLRELPRFGARREERVLRGIAAFRRASGRLKLTQAYPHGEWIVAQLKGRPDILRMELAGTIRRRRDTVGDIDVLVAARAEDAPAIMAAFTGLPGLLDVLACGESRASVRLREGVQADLRVVPPESWGAALHYFTGSKEHNVAIRSLAVRRGLKISEYGVFDDEGRRLGGQDESEIFAAVGLPWIAPELRENRGEIEAAAQGQLPRLVEVGDVQGDLHMHTRETDGRSTLEEMALAARAAGRRYIAITDHSQALAMARGLDPERLRAQGRVIQALNDQLGGNPVVLRGIEADILPDGSVDLGNEVLAGLDWVIASVHSQFGLPRAEQTRRVVRALESGVVDCLGHPTGRLIGRREPYEIDLEAVLAAAQRTGAAVECNSFPDRLDLCDVHLRMARDVGVPVVINTDSHATTHLVAIQYGVWTARRGWLEASHVANTLPLPAFLDRFRDHHRRG